MVSLAATFALCLILMGLAGLKLTQCADAISEHTGVSRGWLGLVGVATITSLPELVTGLSAVTLANSPDMAVGDVLGSCTFNLALLACAALWRRPGALWQTASRSHRWSSGLGALLLAGVAWAIATGHHPGWLRIGHLSIASAMLVAGYVATVWVMSRIEEPAGVAPLTTRQSLVVQPPIGGRPQVALRQALFGFIWSAALILAVGVWLPQIGLQLATSLGWSHGFVGALFIALATSLPEVATTWGALRIGAVDLLFGSLLGSNLFDVLLLAVDDAVYFKGSLFEALAPTQVWVAAVAALMSLVAMLAMSLPRGHPRKILQSQFSGAALSLVLLALYLLSAVVQFRWGA